MQIVFREIEDFSNVWVWAEFYNYPGEKDRENFEEACKAFYIVGRLGGFNSLNLQARREMPPVACHAASRSVTLWSALPLQMYASAKTDFTYHKYDQKEVEEALPAMFHEIGDVEVKRGALDKENATKITHVQQLVYVWACTDPTLRFLRLSAVEGQVVPLLHRHGHRGRAVVRRPDKLPGRVQPGLLRRQAGVHRRAEPRLEDASSQVAAREDVRGHQGDPVSVDIWQSKPPPPRSDGHLLLEPQLKYPARHVRRGDGAPMPGGPDQTEVTPDSMCPSLHLLLSSAAVPAVAGPRAVGPATRSHGPPGIPGRDPKEPGSGSRF